MPISMTKRDAFLRAQRMAQEGKTRTEIVDFLIARYLYGYGEAYALARAAISTRTTPTYTENGKTVGKDLR